MKHVAFVEKEENLGCYVMEILQQDHESILMKNFTDFIVLTLLESLLDIQEESEMEMNLPWKEFCNDLSVFDEWGHKDKAVLQKCSFSIEYEHQPSMFLKNLFEANEGMLYLIPWFFFTKMFSSNSLATTTGEKNLRLF